MCLLRLLAGLHQVNPRSLCMQLVNILLNLKSVEIEPRGSDLAFVYFLIRFMPALILSALYFWMIFFSFFIHKENKTSICYSYLDRQLMNEGNISQMVNMHALYKSFIFQNKVKNCIVECEKKVYQNISRNTLCFYLCICSLDASWTNFKPKFLKWRKDNYKYPKYEFLQKSSTMFIQFSKH